MTHNSLKILSSYSSVTANFAIFVILSSYQPNSVLIYLEINAYCLHCENFVAQINLKFPTKQAFIDCFPTKDVMNCSKMTVIPVYSDI